MLERLIIENVALIDHAEIEFSAGLNILSGETGAGKSVILDALDFALGAKADKGMVRTGTDACSVTAEFTVSPAVSAVLEDLGIEPEETLVIMRRLTADGRGTLRLNGVAVTVAMLRRVTALLVDVHGQSEHFYLLKESNQLRLLDSLAGQPVASEKERVGVLLSKKKEILAELSEFGGDEGERNRRLDILKYQIDELERADLKAGEEEQIVALRNRFRNAEKLLTAFAAVRDCLTGDGAGADCLSTAIRSLSGVAQLDSRYDALSDRLMAAREELSDISAAAEEFSGELDIDAREAERVETRLDEIRTIKKKYGGSVEAAIAFLEHAREEQALLESSAERIEALQTELAKIKKDIYAACVKLTAARKEAAAGFTKRVAEELTTLNIPSARFEVEFDAYSEDDADRAAREGLGGVRFLFSANAGEPLKELGKIISGGEMSRFMLAIKAQLTKTEEIGTYVFDEIDAGVGGKTAGAIAEKFAKIAKNVQVVAVTHLARIAAFADREFVIEKHETKGKTYTEIHTVEGDDRLRELARLIGGESEAVYRHARDLLGEAQNFKTSL